MERENITKVAAHESGHALGAKDLGGEVLKATVRPEGNAAGYVIALFRQPLREKLFSMMANCLHGGMAAEKMGFVNPWEGSTSDLMRFDFFADVISRFFYLGKVSARTIRSWGRSLARNTLPDTSVIFHYSQLLDQKGTL